MAITLHDLFPGSDVGIRYNPLEPTVEDLELWDYNTTRRLHCCWFEERAIRKARDSWSVAARYYVYRLNIIFGFDVPLIPTYQGFVKSLREAAYLVEACLHGELTHSYRGPRDGEATISGNIFIWERNSTGIDDWRDGMEWAVREEEGFDVGEAKVGSGLMKKTVCIPDCGAEHHVVSYYTAWDAQTLDGPLM